MTVPYGMLAGVLARARGGAEDIRRKQKQDEDADVMKNLQRAALLANLEEQGIVPAGQEETVTATIPSYGGKGMSPTPTRSVEVPDAERYKPLGATGYVQDQTRTKRAKEIAVGRDRERKLAQRRAVLKARGLNPDEIDVENDDVYESYAKQQHDDVNWSTVEGKGGFYQVNPRTGQVRRVEGVAPKPPTNTGNQDRSAATTLRGQYNGEQVVKDASTIASAYQRIRSVATNPSAAGDLSLIFSYMKMLDPGSTVREGEFANAQNAAGIPDQVRNLYNRATKGERLNPAQRQDFLNQAENLVNGQRQALSSTRKRYEEIATRNGIDPRDIVHDPFGDVGGGARKTLSVEDAVKAKSDPGFAAWLRAQGYEVP